MSKCNPLNNAISLEEAGLEESNEARFGAPVSDEPTTGGVFEYCAWFYDDAELEELTR